MAAQRSSGKRSSASKKTPQNGNSKVFWSALLLILGLLITAFTVFTGENAWLFIHNTLLGAFGVSVTLVPCILIYCSIMIALDREKNDIAGKVTAGTVLILLVSGAAQIFSSQVIQKGLPLGKIANELVDSGKHFKGGGLFSLIAGVSLISLFGKIGAGVIIVLAIIFFTLMVANKTIIDVFKLIRNAILRLRDMRPEYKEVEDYVPQKPKKQKPPKHKKEVEIPIPSAVRNDRSRPVQTEQIPVTAAVPNADVPLNIAGEARRSFDIDIPIQGENIPTVNYDFSGNTETDTQAEVDEYTRQMVRQQENKKKKKISINDLPFSLDPIGSDKKSKSEALPKDELFVFLENAETEKRKNRKAPVSDDEAVEDLPVFNSDFAVNPLPSSLSEDYIEDYTPDDQLTDDDTYEEPVVDDLPPIRNMKPISGEERKATLSEIIANATRSSDKPSDRSYASAPVTEPEKIPVVSEPFLSHANDSEKRINKASTLASNKIGDDEDLDLPETTAKDIQDEIAENEQTVIEYVIPPFSLLRHSSNELNVAEARAEMEENASILLKTLESFGISAEIVNINRGPSVTRYELLPKAGIKLSKIRSLADDIALRLAAMGGIRIEAPIPGKAAVGIEVPNRIKDVVTLRDVIDTDEFAHNKSKLTFAVGKNIDGEIILGDIASLPHIIIAGTTGSGKSVCTNGIIMSILYNATPEEVRLVLIDPKMVEFKIYNGIPHLLLPVVTDPRKAAGALSWAVQEMLKRYKLFSDNSVRDLNDYNELAASRDDLETIPRIVIVIDELADLMMAAKSEVEDSICRLAQMARAAGMHLIIATQRPTVDVVTGLIKSNIPSRIALRVASGIDSRTILDETGAEKLLGNGDLLYFPTGYPKPVRVQNSYTSSKEVAAVVDFIKNGAGNVIYDEEIIRAVEDNVPQIKGEKPAVPEKTYEGSDEEMTDLAIECAVDAGTTGVSVTYLQRKLKLGYARASRIMDELEDLGIVGPLEGAKPRRVLMTPEQFRQYKLARLSAEGSENETEPEPAVSGE